MFRCMEKENVNTIRIEKVKRTAIPPSGAGRQGGSKYDDFFAQAATSGSKNAVSMTFGTIKAARLAYISAKQVATYRGLKLEIHQRGLSVYGWAK